MIFMACWTYALAAWLLIEIGLRSWARPERLDGSWAWTRPAPALHLCPIGPQPYRGRARMTLPQRDQMLSATPDGEIFWEVNIGAGATDHWSPMADTAEEQARMLPLDDVDEWLATRLSEYGHVLTRISCRRVSLVRGETQCTLDEELERFQQGSMALHAYRSMILDHSREFTMRESMELEALLAA